ncbi:MAG TPA: galactokinase family protein [Phycisphaerae bacterium]|nr:galactokinase family protein [Phycisphaerae bacterium]HQL72890.1 galactokinase family protein [Phycisphaerae bacterium]
MSLPLGRLADVDFARRALAGGGLSAAACDAKAGRLASLARRLMRDRADADAHAFFVPGRIEVLGKHTDYAGGSSVLAAAENGFCAVACGRSDRLVHVYDATFDQSERFEIAPDLAPPPGRWVNYPMTVARRLARNFPPRLNGADIALASDLPPAAGMSSSSAFMVATFLALSAVNDLPARDEYRREIRDALSLAQYLGCVENGQSFGSLEGDRGVGTFGGSEDHTCMLCARPGRLVQYAYCPARFELQFDLPGGLVFAIASSGVTAAKTGNAMESYNRASRLAGAAAAAWRAATDGAEPHLAAILAGADDAMSRLRSVLRAGSPPSPGQAAGSDGLAAPDLLRRAEHFFAENCEIIPAAGEALRRGDLEAFGRAVDRSQQLSESLLGNQVVETVFLARQARELGAVAASAFGAGFGGSVWALVDGERADALLAGWKHAYESACPARSKGARFFTTGAGPAAFELG